MTDTDDDSDCSRTGLNRRAFVATLGAGSVALAGCSGGGGDGGDDGTPTDAPTSADGTTAGGTTAGGTTPDGTTAGTTSGGSSSGFTKEDRSPPAVGSGTRQMEQLDRGLVALFRAEGGHLLRWRLFADDPDGIGFHVYRNGEKITDEPVTGATNYADTEGAYTASYYITPVVDGEEGDPSREVDIVPKDFIGIDLVNPGPRDGVAYHAKDVSVGDLDGDGRYEFVVKWVPEDGKLPGDQTMTHQTYVDAYHQDGSRLWQISMGPNVPAGHYFLPLDVYDFDGDGTAEVAIRTFDATTMGDGTVIGDPDARHLEETGGRLTAGPEFLTIADGETGAPLTTTDFVPERDPVSSWGDDYGNRVNRVVFAAAHLDGARPSLLTCRGEYDRIALQAWDFRDGSLTRRWNFDTEDGHDDYVGQGNQQLSIADCDGDGKDEIVYGACVIDHDGTGLHTTGLGHGDALHVSDFDPDREGLEIWQPHESSNAEYGASLRDADTGEILFGKHTGTDTARGMVADIDPDRKGAEFWAPAGVGTHAATDGYPRIADTIESYNFAVWWTGDLTRELFDAGTANGAGRIYEWTGSDGGEVRRVREFEGTRTTDSTKRFPAFSGDVLGDWREEVVLTNADSTELRIYLTPHETEHRIPNLLHDPQYRAAMAWQNNGYNQPPWPGYYLGTDMDGVPDYDVKPV